MSDKWLSIRYDIYQLDLGIIPNLKRLFVFTNIPGRGDVIIRFLIFGAWLWINKYD